MSWTAVTTPAAARARLRAELSCGCDGGARSCVNRKTKPHPRVRGQCRCECHHEQACHDTAHIMDGES